MALDPAANFVRGTTDAAVDSTQTTVSVDDASIFPDPSTDGEYNVVIWDAANFPRPDQDADVEVLRVTATDTGTNDLTVVRGQEGTSGAAHPSGSAVHLSPMAKMFSDIDSQKLGDGENFDGQGTSAFSNVASVEANESITDPSGLVHRGRIADDLFGIVLESAFSESVGASGTLTWLYDKIEFRQTGATSALEETRMFEPVVGFNPADSGSVRIDLSNVNIDDTTDGRINMMITDAPDGNSGENGDDFVSTKVHGNALIQALTSNDGTSSITDDTTQTNTFVNNLQYGKISWDGVSTVTVEWSDGSTTVTVSDSGNYPTGENLYLKIGAYDRNDTGATTIEFDVDQFQVT